MRDSKMRKKELIEFVVTGLLTLVLIFFVTRAVKIKNKSSNLAGKGEAMQHVQEPVDLFSKLEQESAQMELGRDPFSTALIKRAKDYPRGLNLNGIIWDKQKPVAIINENIVEVGSEIEGNRVVDIQKNKVILNDGSANFELKLGE